ncbi:Nramp family divalent metal transporter [Nocardioides euryhalodurans]|uniref:Divalent metal cation transporter n=1 Tax=Nocardioides euryhalodurans TaxID=2518370 RepID=A0A4P7GMK6_9ACTN|nr:Nramp family divalent metal transporter [Nocardioides euryhalodurans]QBR93149.1 divalent metal cation transporter [Nocardioides euryhalodurans]
MDTSSAPSTRETKPRWSLIGPGIVVAATGVGGADLVATLIAGSNYGYALLWAVVIGCLMKVVLVEGAGRYTLATGHTIYEGWASLGRWTTWYFAPYIVIWGFVYGAAAMAGTGLPLASLLPFLPIEAWGIISGLLGLALVWSGRYGFFEKVCAALVGLMFVAMVMAAALTVPNLPELATGLAPMVPDGALFTTLAVAGGVGGTITLAAYGYWVREKGWSTESHMRVMRLDNGVAYLVTGLFVVATLIVGAELLYSANIAISEGEQGLLDLGNVLEDRYGAAAGTIFLIGFWAAAMSSLVGVWNGVSMMFADFLGHVRKLPEDHVERGPHGTAYKGYILWLTIPPIVPLLMGEPFYLILLYGVLGALFMPFLAITLLLILNSDRVPGRWRNKLFSNVLMAATALVFLVLAVQQLRDQISGLL